MAKTRTPRPRRGEPTGPVFGQWAEKVGWKKRVNAVCKPCWELKYCPYGVLVEQFPLQEDRSDMSCRIYGHDCPVFYVCEPFTETRQLRNISRTIPRQTQFRVLKRDNQICSVCNNPVRDENIEFDHVIPWSKGGSSEDNNIRLLCRPCNRRRRAEFEDEFLVNGFTEHLSKPMDLGFVTGLRQIVFFGREFESKVKRPPAAEDFAKEFSGEKNQALHREAAAEFLSIRSFFKAERPGDVSARAFRALKLRWGGGDGTVYSLREVSEKRGIPIRDVVSAERRLMHRLGWFIERGDSIDMEWCSL